MELSKQVVSLELSKELKENGYPQEGLWWWNPGITNNKVWWEVRQEPYNYGSPREPKKEVAVIAPTVAELGEALPDYFYTLRDKGCFPNKWICDSIDTIGSCLIDKKYKNIVSKSADTEANARAKCWLYLKKEGLLCD